MSEPETLFPSTDARPSPLPTPVVDIYGLVHKGLRRASVQLLTRLGSTDPADAHGVQMALDDIDGLLDLCESHAAHEERFLHPALEARRRGSSLFLARDHAAQADHVAELRVLCELVACPKHDNLPARWRTLGLRFAAFVGANLEHMSREEELAQVLLDELYDGQELAALQRLMLSSIGPEERVQFMRAMLPAVTRAEREVLLAALRGLVSPETLGAVVCGLARELADAEALSLIGWLAAECADRGATRSAKNA